MSSSVSKSLVRLVLGGLLTMALFDCSIDNRDLDAVTSGLQPSGGAAGEGSSGDGSALLAVSVPAVDFGNVTVGFPSRWRIGVRNDGVSTLSAPTVARSADSSADFQLIQNQCGAELVAGASCDVTVQFVPSSAGVGQARLDIGSANGGAQAVTLAGQGLPGGDLSLAPVLGSFEDFGGVDLGAATQGRFTISNPRPESSGPLTFSVNRPEFTLLPAAAGECTPGVSPLANGESCDVSIAFSPTARGLAEATLTATSPAGGSVSLNLSGKGLQAGTLTASGEGLDFGGVVLQQSGLGALQFENTGDRSLTLGGARLEPLEASQFSILSSDCADGMELLGAASCSVQLQYRPTDIGVANSAELVVGVSAGDELRLPLSGVGLQPGALLLAGADAANGPDFGDVLVGETQTRTFAVSNPGNQASGVLSLVATGGFQIVSPPEAGDCVDATTSLGTGESCTVRISLSPTERQPLSGALTVSSALAGASSVALAARGVLDAKIEVSPQVDFGRVLTNASAVRAVTIKNAGDRELPPPALEITSESLAQQAAFTFESACSAPLAANATCDVAVTWTPTEAIPHSANLRLVADPGGTSTVLLVGQALAPGSLQLAVAETAGPDFGDVALGATATRTFVLTNPGNEPSGRITVTSDDAHFLPSLGDCNTGAPDGLVDGSSCTFSVVFTPDGSDALVANLSVQSPGAGRSGLELRGRGRAPATLTAAGNRDLGRANIGQATLTQPANSFDWTVSNDGDLATGALSVVSSSAEFQVGADTCAATALAGRTTCQMTIRFVPAEPAGMRQATVTVSDAVSGSSATVAVTGLAVRIAQPGQSCINAECATGSTCTNGVCCDRPCDGTCQFCSAAGVCTDQSGQEPCGAGGGRCFGVDECKLPADAACGSTADCGGDLQCKACTTGGSRCTAPAACCGACPGSTTCQNGVCDCSAVQVDCGNNLCIPMNRADVCCPVSPSCPANVPVCRNDGQCVGCLGDGDCGTCQFCNQTTSTCQSVGSGQSCGPGLACTADNRCVQQQCSGPGSTQCGQCNTCTADFQCVGSGPTGGPETCGDGVDNNCNGVVDDGCQAPEPEPPAQPAQPAQPTPPVAPATDPNCDTGLPRSGACCAAACGECGGPGCSQRPGGAAACCTGTIGMSGNFCTFSGPPCIITQLTPNSDPLCETGQAVGNVCCLADCAQCTGTGCGTTGRGSECCSGDIADTGRVCSGSLPPCIME